MSAAPRVSAAHAGQADGRHAESGPRRPTTLSIRWTISRAAISASRPDLIPPGTVSVHDPELVLTIVTEPDRDGAVRIARAHAWLHDPATGRKPVVESAPSLIGAVWTEERESGLIHVDMPGWASFTAQSAPDGMVLRYARTTVLLRLGLAGGRYEMPQTAPI